jgi:hypothetical protein
MERQLALFEPPLWRAIKDGDDDARRFFDQHYSRTRYADGRMPKLFVGPGYKLVLVTPCRRALFVRRKFISGDGQQGVNCAIFRNVGAGLSSDLIRCADLVADDIWPGERHYTYVDPRKTAARRGKSRPPGFCFIQAGWQACGETKVNKLLILERLPRAIEFNRFLEYRKRGNVPLTAPDFPLLTN